MSNKKYFTRLNVLDVDHGSQTRAFFSVYDEERKPIMRNTIAEFPSDGAEMTPEELINHALVMIAAGHSLISMANGLTACAEGDQKD